MRQFGIVGAAVAWTLRVTADFVALALCDKIGRDILLTSAVRGAAVVAAVLAFMLPTNVLERTLMIVGVAVFLAWHLHRHIPPEVYALLRRPLFVAGSRS
jgi:hypothetical protein